MENLIRMKKLNEMALVLNYWRNPQLYDNYYIESDTILDEEARNVHDLGKALYNNGYDLDNIASVIEFLELHPQYDFLKDTDKFYYLKELEMTKKAISTVDFETRFNEQVLLATKIKALQYLKNKDTLHQIIHATNTQELLDTLSIDIENLSSSRYYERVKHGGIESDDDFIQRYTNKEVGYDFEELAPLLNDSFNGFKFGRMSSIAGLSGVGKSQFTTYFAIYSQLEKGNKVLLITNELSISDYNEMLYCIVCKEKFNYTFNRSWFQDMKFMCDMVKNDTIEFQMLLKARNYVKENYKDLLHIIDINVSSMKEVAKNIRIYSKQGYQLCVYDTAKPDSSTGQAWADVQEMMKELNNICKFCNVHLFMPWQIANQYADNKRLTRQHLSESKDLPKMLTNFATIRLLHEDEYITCEKQISCSRIIKDETGIPINEIVKLDKDKKYIVLYLDKLRFSGNTRKHLLFEFDSATCTFKEIGVCYPKKDTQQFK